MVRQLRKAFPYREKKWKANPKNKSKKNIEKKEQKEENEEASDQDSDEEFFSKGTKNRHKKTLPQPKLPAVNLDV